MPLPADLPIKVLRWQDAVKMKYEGTADVVAEYDDVISSPSVTWKMPAVVRLKSLSRSQKRGVKFSRVNIYQRDRYTCQYCGQRFAYHELSYDHVVPRASGGRTVFENIVTACRPCNSRKDNMTCDEAGTWPLHEPRKPTSLPIASPVIDVAWAPPEWHPFLVRT